MCIQFRAAGPGRDAFRPLDDDRRRPTLTTSTSRFRTTTVLKHLDGHTLNNIAQTCRWFTRCHAGETRVCEAIAKQRLLDQHGGSLEAASRFKSYSWKERLYIEEDAPVWFDMPTCRQSGIHVSQVRIYHRSRSRSSSSSSSRFAPRPLPSPHSPTLLVVLVRPGPTSRHRSS